MYKVETEHTRRAWFRIQDHSNSEACSLFLCRHKVWSISKEVTTMGEYSVHWSLCLCTMHGCKTEGLVMQSTGSGENWEWALETFPWACWPRPIILAIMKADGRLQSQGLPGMLWVQNQPGLLYGSPSQTENLREAWICGLVLGALLSRYKAPTSIPSHAKQIKQDAMSEKKAINKFRLTLLPLTVKLKFF